LRRDPKEGQLLERMACAVPCNKFRAPRQIVDCRPERQISGGDWRAYAERKSEDSPKGRAAPMSASALVRHDVSSEMVLNLIMPR
jgi:hypothetical protein